MQRDLITNRKHSLCDNGNKNNYLSNFNITFLFNTMIRKITKNFYSKLSKTDNSDGNVPPQNLRLSNFAYKLATQVVNWTRNKHEHSSRLHVPWPSS